MTRRPSILSGGANPAARNSPRVYCCARPRINTALAASTSRSKTTKTTSTTTLGAPSAKRPESGEFTSAKGIQVTYQVESIRNADEQVNHLIDLIDDQHGVLLTSSYEYPGRYARWTVGFVAPAFQIEGQGANFILTPLNDRGQVLIRIIYGHLKDLVHVFALEAYEPDTSGTATEKLRGAIIPSSGSYFSEEERSKQHSLFSLIREIRSIFASPEAGQLGLYGSLGYDLAFQFEPISMKKDRDSATQRDLVMYFPDEILVVDNQKNDAWKIKYEFQDSSDQKLRTAGLARLSKAAPYSFAEASTPFLIRDNAKGEYAQQVIRAKEEFRVGNLFEVVLSQTFREKLLCKPSEIFKRYHKGNGYVTCKY